MWSISYFSWLTFIFLLLASIFWLVPKKRETTMKCSPFLVGYAYFLLACAYIYSMDLKKEELPPVVHITNLIEISFSRNTIWTLVFKCLFTSTFLLTLRVHMKKKIMSKKPGSLSSGKTFFVYWLINLPYLLNKFTVNDKQNVKMNHCLLRTGNFLMKLFTRLWIWIVVITLFVVAIIGEQMTAFKIIYMSLFIIFLFVFQVWYFLLW